MILHSLIAKNILKYKRLELSVLPGKGLIVINGLNESGKSSIGEAMCFALFGRTFSLSPSQISKIIRWGASRCATKIIFSAVDGNEYCIERVLDDYEQHVARIWKTSNREIIASGLRDVAKCLTGLLRFGYAEFIESFYFAQRQFIVPDAPDVALQEMSGVASIKRAERLIGEEITQQIVVKETVNKELMELCSQRSSIDYQHERLETLENEYNSLSSDKDKHVVYIETLGDVDKYISSSIQPIKNISQQMDLLVDKQIKYNIFASIIAAALAFISFLWFLLVFYPHREVTNNIAIFLGIHALENGIWQLDVIVIIIGLCGLSLIGNYVNSKQTNAKLLKHVCQVVKYVSSIEDRLTELSGNEKCGIGTDVTVTFIHEHDIGHYRGRMIYFADEFASKATYLNKIFTDEINKQNSYVEELHNLLAKLDKEISDEYLLKQRVQMLEQWINVKSCQLDECNHKIKTREYALTLLPGACEHMVKRFYIAIERLISTILPVLTAGHYEHVKIDNKLNVKIFSTKKHNYLEYAEVSSGTQQQVKLALRLALSQAMIKSVIRSPQFLFLDEPFVYSDKERMYSAISALQGMAEDFPQIFILMQHIPTWLTADHQIDCQAGSCDLTVNTA